MAFIFLSIKNANRSDKAIERLVIAWSGATPAYPTGAGEAISFFDETGRLLRSLWSLAMTGPRIDGVRLSCYHPPAKNFT